MSKKGSFFSLVTGVQEVVLLVIIMFVFGLIFLALSAKTELEENKYFPSEDIRLLNYLKTSINYKSESIKLGDFIIESTKDNDKFTFLQNELKDLLKFRFDGEYSNVMIIEYNGEIASSADNYMEGYFIKETEKTSKINLPTKNQKENIIVTLHSGKLTYPEQYEIPSIIEELPAEVFVLDPKDYPNAVEILNKKSLGIKLKDPSGEIWINFGKVGAFDDNNYWTKDYSEICQKLEFKSYLENGQPGYKYLICDGEISDVIISNPNYQDKFKTSEELYNLYYK